MGILILSVIILIISIIIVSKDYNKVVSGVFLVFIVISGCASLISGLSTGANYFGRNVAKYEMELRKERIETLLKETDSPFYSTFKDSSMGFNDNMKTIEKYNESFWLYGLSSFVTVDTIPLK